MGTHDVANPGYKPYERDPPPKRHNNKNVIVDLWKQVMGLFDSCSSCCRRKDFGDLEEEEEDDRKRATTTATLTEREVAVAAAQAAVVATRSSLSRLLALCPDDSDSDDSGLDTDSEVDEDTHDDAVLSFPALVHWRWRSKKKGDVKDNQRDNENDAPGTEERSVQNVIVNCRTRLECRRQSKKSSYQ